MSFLHPDYTMFRKMNFSVNCIFGTDFIHTRSFVLRTQLYSNDKRKRHTRGNKIYVVTTLDKCDKRMHNAVYA